VEINQNGFLDTFNPAYHELSEVANVSCPKHITLPWYRSQNFTPQIRRYDKNFHENEADHFVTVGYTE